MEVRKGVAPMWWMVSITVLISIFIMIFITKLSVTIYFKHVMDDQQFKITIRAWGLKHIINVPLIKVAKDEPAVVVKTEKPKQEQEDKKKFTVNTLINGMKKVQTLLDKVVGFHRIVKLFLKHVHVGELKWHSFFGIGDAADTGMLTGGIWALKGNVVGLVHHYMDVQVKPDIKVVPLFQQSHVETHVTCMFSFRIGHAIVAALRLLRHGKKLLFKGGKTSWPNIQSKDL